MARPFTEINSRGRQSSNRSAPHPFPFLASYQIQPLVLNREGEGRQTDGGVYIQKPLTPPQKARFNQFPKVQIL